MASQFMYTHTFSWNIYACIPNILTAENSASGIEASYIKLTHDIITPILGSASDLCTNNDIILVQWYNYNLYEPYKLISVKNLIELFLLPSNIYL